MLYNPKHNIVIIMQADSIIMLVVYFIQFTIDVLKS